MTHTRFNTPREPTKTHEEGVPRKRAPQFFSFSIPEVWLSQHELLAII